MINKFSYSFMAKFTKKQSGFTLVEVMVALMIAAMALPALVTLVLAQVDGAAHVREKTYAMWIAENQLTRLNLLNNRAYFPNFKLPEKDAGKAQMMGLDWQWQMQASKDERVPLLVKVDIGIAPIGIAENKSNSSDSLGQIDPMATLTSYLRAD